MKFFKKRKNKILFGVFASTIAASVVLGAGLYYLNSDSRSKLRSFSSTTVNPNLINNNNLDLRGVDSSITDQNLKELDKKEEQKTEDNEINTKTEQKPDEKDSKKPENDTTDKNQNANGGSQNTNENVEIGKQNNDKKDNIIANNDDKVDIAKIISEDFYFKGLKFKIKVNKLPQNNQNPSSRGQSGNPSIKLIDIEVTDQLRELNRQNIKSAFERKSPKDVLEELNHRDEQEEANYIQDNKIFFNDLFDKYHRLFDAPNDKVKEFLNEDGQKIYDSQIRDHYSNTIKSLEISEKNTRNSERLQDIQRKKVNAKNHKYIQLLKYLDYSKFKVTEKVQENLRKGILIDENEQNVYVNENGELESNSTSSSLLKNIESGNNKQ
ncbi:putative immunoglobulin-blocking virulence protein [[Mycoplasma] phocae]|uniref:Putative immunoglobulin-blocking virulence protein n=1 Tax=[Mycoplasma] phocae TaxID=142651 RepID=A0A2Z5ISA6_9BACT|nr:hypothetical protein [[Mycoplasma] phocae]AXE60528.1 putative immunoglobulin-blocking virulence protein [[Mycoplasma] phocae]